MLLKEGNDPLIQVIQTSHPIGHPVSVVGSNHAAPKELLKCVEQLDVSQMLYNRELRKDLKARGHLRVRVDADEETTFTVDKPHDPMSIEPLRSRLNVKSLRVLHNGAFPADCPHVRWILTVALESDEYQTAVRGVSRI